MRVLNFDDLYFDLLRSLKVKCDSAIGLPIYGFLLMVNRNIRPNTALLRDISVQNLGDFDFELSISLKVKSNGAGGLPIYDFLLLSYNNYVSNLHRLGVIVTRKKCSYLLSLGSKIDSPPPHTHTHPYTGRLFSKSNGFLPELEGRLSPKMKLIGSTFF